MLEKLITKSNIKTRGSLKIAVVFYCIASKNELLLSYLCISGADL